MRDEARKKWRGEVTQRGCEGQTAARGKKYVRESYTFFSFFMFILPRGDSKHGCNKTQYAPCFLHFVFKKGLGLGCVCFCFAYLCAQASCQNEQTNT